MYKVRHKNSNWMAIGRWLVFLPLVFGCGYQMVTKGAFPGNARTIAVKVLSNRSIETGAEAIITNALADELNRRRPGVLQRVDGADAVLAGTIGSIDHETVARSGTLTALQERVTVKVSLTLTDRSGKTLWRRASLIAREDYGVVDGDKTATQDNRRSAIAKAALRLAEDVFRGLTDNF